MVKSSPIVKFRQRMLKILNQWQRFWWKHQKCFLIVGLILITTIFVASSKPLIAQEDDLDKYLPPLQPHPLPPTLVEWQDSSRVGDYFEQISQSPAGYLVWSRFPITVYCDRPTDVNDPSASNRRFVEWTAAVTEAIRQWQVYLPIAEVKTPKLADIVIERSDPPLDTSFDPKTGQLNIPRARSAQTRYDFYFTQENPPILSHRMTIKISPRLSQLSILSAARHELGHGLGIWGHSDQETDVLYFSQVRNPPSISPRDINTLKKIYEQPTRLGWPLLREIPP